MPRARMRSTSTVRTSTSRFATWLMKMPAERIPPMMIAWVRSSVIVARKVTRKVSTPVLKRCENMKRIDAHSFMRTAVTMRTPASAVSGTSAMIGAASKAAASSASAWMMLTSRVCPPDLMPTDERAMAAVAGTPPKKGMMMLPMPCATNSWLACRRTPVIFEPTAPQSSDSTAPSAATDSAGITSSLRCSHGMASTVSRWSSRIVRGISPM